jgi:hypothetical protein
VYVLFDFDEVFDDDDKQLKVLNVVVHNGGELFSLSKHGFEDGMKFHYSRQ